MSSVTLNELRSALSEADFPATKDDLVASAESTGAGADALAALRSLPPEVPYANVDEVVRSVTTDVE
jgi:hypothetical protein